MPDGLISGPTIFVIGLTLGSFLGLLVSQAFHVEPAKDALDQARDELENNQYLLKRWTEENSRLKSTVDGLAAENRKMGDHLKSIEEEIAKHTSRIL